MANKYLFVKIEWWDSGYNSGNSFFAAIPEQATAQEVSKWALKKLIKSEFDEEYIEVENILFICSMDVAPMFLPDAFRYIASGRTKTYPYTFSGNITNLCRKNSCYGYDRPPDKFLVMGGEEFEYLRTKLKKYSRQYKLDV